MTLENLLTITEASVIALIVPLTLRLNSTIIFCPNDSAELDDILFHYGKATVKKIEAEELSALKIKL